MGVMKTILKVLGIFLLLLALGLVVFTLSLNSTIKIGIENIGSEMTGTDVAVGTVTISLISGEIHLENLLIANPPGFQSDFAFNFGRVQVKADLGTLWSQNIHLHEIVIDSPEISFESTTNGSNIGIIHKNLNDYAGSDGQTEGDQSENPTDPQTESSDEQKIVIDHFFLQNGLVLVSTTLLKDQKISIRLPEVQIRDIGKDSGGISLKEISSIIYSATQDSIEEQISKSGIPLDTDLKKLEKKLGGALKGASKFLEGFKGLLGK